MNANNEKFTPAHIIAALQAAGGIKLGAAQKLKCSPQTIQNYIDRYPEVKAAYEQVSEDLLDVAETELLKKLRGGNLTAIIFYLKTKGKARGYIERVENTGKNGRDLLPKGTQVAVFEFPANGRDVVVTTPGAAEADTDDDD